MRYFFSLLVAGVLPSKKASVRIVDGFTFFNEVEMLEMRLRYLFDHVDEFLIVEADRRFSGEPKPFMLHELFSSPRFSWAKSKVTIKQLTVDVSTLDLSVRPEQFDKNAASWKIEAQQRDAIRPTLFGAHDVLLMGDVDEIPDVGLIAALRASPWRRLRLNFWPIVCEQKLLYYNFKSLRGDVWRGTVAMGVISAHVATNQRWRDKRKKLMHWKDGGWHFSYFMTAEQISDKIRSFSHQELNTEAMRDPKRIQAAIEQGQDLFGRGEAVRYFDPQRYPPELRSLLIRYFPC